ncbi:MAG TPA: metallophosphoesterase [Longimicrobiaceae bacterium]|nr:metallophosphoesterase [Longimicrobiaceae bacterium]
MPMLNVPPCRRISAACSLSVLRWLWPLWLVALVSCATTPAALPPPAPQRDLGPAYAERVEQRVVLIGDAGDPRLVDEMGRLVAREPVLTALEQWASELPDRTLVVFLGDNVYSSGLPPEGHPRRLELARLNAQVRVVQRSGARGLFVPGNHDWYRGAEGVRAQQQVVEAALGPGSFLPVDGSPGPAFLDLAGIRIVALDTYRWLRTHVAPCDDDAPAPSAELDSLRTLVADSPHPHTLVVAHHPLASYGPHRGVNWLRRIKNAVMGDDQDLETPAYRCMRRQFTRVLAGPHRPLAFAGGHDHSLQLMRGDSVADWLLVSGAGSRRRLSGVARGPDTELALQRTGFFVLDVLRDGPVRLRAVTPDAEGVGHAVYDHDLRQQPTTGSD